MKTVACLSVFCGCVAVGLVIYFRARSRVRFCSGLVAFCNNLQVEIGFTLTPISQIIDNYIGTYPNEFARALARYQRLLNERNDITRERCAEIVPIPQVADFFYELGRHGANEEQAKIAGAAGVFAEMKRAAEDNLKNRAVVALKLAVIAGIAGVILLL
jgi:hypothetical protein